MGFPFLVAKVQVIDDPETVDADIEGRANDLKERATEILKLYTSPGGDGVLAAGGGSAPHSSRTSSPD